MEKSGVRKLYEFDLTFRNGNVLLYYEPKEKGEEPWQK
jgi:hypothetical protein